MNDYERIARVIRYIEEQQLRQPALGEIAARSGLSESHLHRLFHRWAGVTPKGFLQCLSAEHAKARLRESASVLDAALDAGFSGPGRLHDLLVNLEAASPGEIKSGGEGMIIEWGSAETPFGLCTIAWNRRGICHLAFRDAQSETPPRELVTAWPRAEFRKSPRAAAGQAALVFNAEARNATTLKAFVRGSEFQLKVWRALLRIPPGCVASYRRLAAAVCGPKAARAVGAACGANPIAYLIPCHRVIRETGIVQGYRWGNVRKRTILGREFSQSCSQGNEAAPANKMASDHQSDHSPFALSATISRASRRPAPIAG